MIGLEQRPVYNWSGDKRQEHCTDDTEIGCTDPTVTTPFAALEVGCTISHVARSRLSNLIEKGGAPTHWKFTGALPFAGR